DYNRYMGSVDIADQLHSYFFTQCVVHQNWQPFFYWLLDTVIINTYRLAQTNGSQITHQGFCSSLTSSLVTAIENWATPKLAFTFLYRN
ncbi:hypothetical protein L873DRAFT_1660467, partial [Choiromyces venosus 120613-1]